MIIDGRILIISNKNIRIGFIISQQNIVFRPVFLNQILLEDQCIGFRVGNGELYMMNISDQSPGLFRTQIFDEIRMKTVGKILGLSNIDNLIFFISC